VACPWTFPENHRQVITEDHLLLQENLCQLLQAFLIFPEDGQGPLVLLVYQIFDLFIYGFGSFFTVRFIK